MSRGLSSFGERRVFALCAVSLVGVVALCGAPEGYAVCKEVLRIAGLPNEIRHFVEGWGMLGPVVFILAQVVQVLIAVIPAGPLTLAGVVAFGFWGGFAFSLVGAMLGSMMAFGIGRRWGEPVVVRLVGEKNLECCAEKLRGGEGRVIFVAMLLPIPAGGDVVCALAGLSTISLKRFFLLVLAGRLPSTAANALLVSGLISGLTRLLTVGIIVLVLLGFTWIQHRRLRARRAKETPLEVEKPGAVVTLPVSEITLLGDPKPVECEA